MYIRWLEVKLSMYGRSLWSASYNLFHPRRCSDCEYRMHQKGAIWDELIALRCAVKLLLQSLRRSALSHDSTSSRLCGVFIVARWRHACTQAATVACIERLKSFVRAAANDGPIHESTDEMSCFNANGKPHLTHQSLRSDVSVVHTEICLCNRLHWNWQRNNNRKEIVVKGKN